MAREYKTAGRGISLSFMLLKKTYRKRKRKKKKKKKMKNKEWQNKQIEHMPWSLNLF